MELEGRVIKVMPTASGVSQVTGNQWRKQEFLFGYYENPSDIYERRILLSIMNDNIEKYNLKENTRVKVRIQLTCREYNGRYFNDIRTGDITVLGSTFAQGAQQAPQGSQQAAQSAQTAASAQQQAVPVQSPQAAQFPPKVDAAGNPVQDDLPF